MKPEEILSYEPKVLSQEQREFYFENGYLQLESFVDQDWLDRLWSVTNRLIEDSSAAYWDEVNLGNTDRIVNPLPWWRRRPTSRLPRKGPSGSTTRQSPKRYRRSTASQTAPIGTDASSDNGITD